MSNETKTSSRGTVLAVTTVLAVAAIGAYHGIVNFENSREGVAQAQEAATAAVEAANAAILAANTANATATQALEAAQKATADAEAATRAARNASAAAPAGGEAAASGWFSEEQVARGEDAYQSICAMCHGDDVADSFASFSGSAQEMMETFIGLGMPATNPGGLPAQQYIDIAAYIFNRGGLPLGAEVVAGTPEAAQAGL